MVVHFVTFASPKFTGTLRRIKEEMMSVGYADVVHALTEQDLDPDFMERHRPFIDTHPRGYGYWIWKPQVCLQTFREMKEGDILLYADSGCRINNDRPRFKEYLSMVEKDGSLSFQFGTNSDKDYRERCWCKCDLFERLSAYEFVDTPQIISTAFLLKKNDVNVELIKQWLSLCEDYHLLDDTPSLLPNLSGFCEHRHDQVIFSLLRKKAGFSAISNEVDHGHGPIHGERLRF